MFELRAHEPRVGRDCLPYPVHRARQLVLELLAHDLDQALLELLGLGVEIALRLTALVRQHEQPEPGEETRRQDAGHVDRNRTRRRHYQRAPASATATVATALRTDSASSFASASRS